MLRIKADGHHQWSVHKDSSKKELARIRKQGKEYNIALIEGIWTGKYPRFSEAVHDLSQIV